jgi:hypothetical protein
MAHDALYSAHALRTWFTGRWLESVPNTGTGAESHWYHHHWHEHGSNGSAVIFLGLIEFTIHPIRGTT